MPLTSNRTAMEWSDTYHRSAGLDTNRFPTIEGFGKGFGTDAGQQKRKVNCYKPMLMPPNQPQGLDFAATHSNPAKPNASKVKAPVTLSALKFDPAADQSRQKGDVQAQATSSPRTIPGRGTGSSSSSGSLIKAFPAYKQPFSRQPNKSVQTNEHLSAGYVPTPKGSWTERQLRFDTTIPDADKTAKDTTTRIGKNGNVVGITATRPAVKETKPEEVSLDHAAWKFRFKKKWIREELHARKQDFPDDPDYSDPWQDAGDFIVRHGYKTTMQAALMGAAKDNPTEVQKSNSLSSFENLSFSDDEDVESDSTVPSNHDSDAIILSRAKTLIAMTQRVNAVRLAS